MTSRGPNLRLHAADQDRARRLAGDEAAFREFVAQYYPLAYGLACRALDDRQDAEEVVQDAFMRIHRALDEFRGDASLKTWVLRIVWRLSLNRRRDRARSAWRRLGLHRHDEDTDPVLPAPAAHTPEAQLLSAETRRQVRSLIDELSPPLREALILNSFEDLRYEEIASILDVPVGTVYSRIHAARRQLGDRLHRAGLT